MTSPRVESLSPAFAFVLAMGIVNLFGDMTYEGGASINGPFLGTLGASAAAVSIIAGFGEFLGYSLRSVAGYVADRTGRYWVVTFVGYAINLLASCFPCRPASTITAGVWMRPRGSRSGTGSTWSRPPALVQVS